MALGGDENEGEAGGERADAGSGAASDASLDLTVALEVGAGGVPAGALDATLPVQRGVRAAQAAALLRGGLGDGSPAGGAGGPHVHGGSGDGGGLGDGDGSEGRRRPVLSRRVLFAAGGLVLVGGCGVAAAARMSGSRSSGSPSASPFGPGSPTPSSARPSPSAPTHPAGSRSGSPADLSSSSAAATHSPGAGSGGAGGGAVPTAPQYYVHAGPKVIALTLDDGPSEYTPQVLSLLQQYGIRATFCMIGRQVAGNHGLVSEVVAAGHTIVNHTWDHADQSKRSASAIRSEITRTNDALSAVGVNPTIFRAPYGAWSKTVFQQCTAAGLRPLDWSVDPQDWARPGTNTIVSRILHQTRTGSIILEHDGGGDRSQTVAALKIVIPHLLDEGYRFTHV